jgi:hypothetical protein
MLNQIQAKLARNYKRQIRYYLAEDRLKDKLHDEHWVKRQLEIARLIQKNYFESCAIIRGNYPPPDFITSQSRRVVERELLGKWK